MMAYEIQATVDTVKNGVGGTLNMRASASSGSSIVATIPDKSTIYVSSLSGTWLAAKYGTKTGYVMGKFVKGATEYGGGSTSTHPQTKADAFGGDSVILNNGSNGPRVKNVQYCVRDTDGTPIDIDGQYGPLTANAVKVWQMSRGMAQCDGIVGNDTKTALWSEYATSLKQNGYM